MPDHKTCRNPDCRRSLPQKARFCNHCQAKQDLASADPQPSGPNTVQGSNGGVGTSRLPGHELHTAASAPAIALPAAGGREPKQRTGQPKADWRIYLAAAALVAFLGVFFYVASTAEHRRSIQEAEHRRAVQELENPKAVYSPKEAVESKTSDAAAVPREVADLRSRTIATLSTKPVDKQRLALQAEERSQAARLLLALSAEIAKRPRDAKLYLDRATTYRDLESINKAIADFTTAIGLDPTSLDGYLGRADARRDQGDLDGAVADYTLAARYNPDDEYVYIGRADVRCKRGDFDGAIADSNEAIRLNPNSATGYRLRGDVRLAKGDYVGAIADYTEAIRRDRRNSALYGSRADAYAANGRHAEAIADYSEQIARRPKDSTAYRKRGDARAVMKDFDGAKSDYTEAIRIGPQPEFKGGFE